MHIYYKPWSYPRPMGFVETRQRFLSCQSRAELGTVQQEFPDETADNMALSLELHLRRIWLCTYMCNSNIRPCSAYICLVTR